jgi:protein TonB
MLITKFDLYNAEWLDLVFDHRNKEYGAYELRQHYGQTMMKAMGMTFAGLAILVSASIVFKPKPQEMLVMREMPILNMKQLQQVKPIEKPKQAKPQELSKATEPIKTISNLPPVVVPTDPIVQPHTMAELQQSATGSTETDGKNVPGNIYLETKGNGGDGTTAVPVDNSVHDVGGLEVMPEPVGGAAAWSKFLQKNLRFPGVAQDAGVSGRVLMSFVIEKDGSLSNIKVERVAGYGFDEEATRVLKLAKAWKPGMQNGQPVRVKYVIPMNFQLAEQN